MFTWICPQCGREVPPSYTECPDCAAKKAFGPPQPVPSTGAPSTVPPKRLAADAQKRHLPGWALSLIFALGFLALGIGGFYGYRHFFGGKRTTASIAFESPPAAPAPTENRNVLAKYIEVTGLRLTEDSSKRVEAQFLVVNHSGADIANLAGNVTLRPRTDEEDEQPVGTFSFQVSSLGPYESRDLKTAVDTNLRAYELPDWQFLRADVQITSP